LKKFLVICVLLFSVNAYSATQQYGAISLTGGATGALDSIDVTIDAIANGDKAVVKTTSVIYEYLFNSSSAATESSPYVVKPDLSDGSSYSGDGRWILVWSSGRVITSSAAIDQGDSAIVGTLAWHISDAAGAKVTVRGLSGVKLVSQTITVPATMTLQLEQGCILTDDASNANLTINGHVEAGIYQIFDWGNGSGTLTLGALVTKAYPEWWGVDGTADEVQINAAITAMTSGVVLLSDAYATAATINLKTKVHVKGLAGGNGNGTVITYSGSGSAIKGSGVKDVLLADFNVITTDDDANGIELGTASKRDVIERVYLKGTIAATTTGAGFLLAAGAGWSGGLAIRDCYVLGYKYGVKMTGTNISTGTWTTVDMTNLWLVGRSAGIVAGSAGIYMDALTNGIGTYSRGGTIESFALGIEHINGGFGGDFVSDFEGNTADYSVGASFCGEITTPSEYTFLKQGTNSTTNKWIIEKHAAGQYTHETYYDHKYSYFGTGGRFWGFYGGATPFADGGDPYPMGGFYGNKSYHTPGASPEHNYMFILDRKITFATAAPTGGTWAQGSVIFNAASATGVSPAWSCVHSGTFSAATDSTGDTDGSTAVITGMADTSDFAVGNWVDVTAGFPTTGPYKVLALTSTTMTLDTSSDSAESNITVDTSDPTFLAWAALP